MSSPFETGFLLALLALPENRHDARHRETSV
jgi:hypothetical protein